MLASMRSGFLLFFVIAFFVSVSAFLPVQAQVSGVFPSVTSMGFGGRPFNGARPSVTSFGPNPFANNWSVYGTCCANLFWPAKPISTLDAGRRHHRRERDGIPIGILEPAYIPYAVPYDPETDDDSVVADASGTPMPPPAIRRAGIRSPDLKPDLNQPDPNQEEPVAAQPLTILIFKDGRQSDVLNYAIVGDTLFDFAAGRTRKIPLADLDLKATQKANDDRGVDFQIPVRIAGQ